MTFKLRKSTAKEEAERLIKRGGGTVNSLEVIEWITRLLTPEQRQAAKFVRNVGTMVHYSADEVEIALKHQMDIRPLI